VIKVIINADLCIGCRFCAIKCPEEVLDLRSDVLAFIADLDSCTGCGICERCPEKAIVVTGGTKRRTKVISTGRETEWNSAHA
jgi:2-oxoglutarate ferredoxin oxidoreductase subunit delta